MLQKWTTGCEQPVPLEGAVTNDCKVGEGGRGWSEERVKPRSFLRKLSPPTATHKSETTIRYCTPPLHRCSFQVQRRFGTMEMVRCNAMVTPQ